MDQKNSNTDWDKLLIGLENDLANGKLLNQEEQELLTELLAIKAEAADLLQDYKDYHTETQWIKIKGYIEAQKNPKRALKLWPAISIAAAIAVVLFGIGIFYKINPFHKYEEISEVNDIAPGKQGATLTLSNGKKIRLLDVSSGKITGEEGVIITKDHNGQIIYKTADRSTESNRMNTLSTANGETFKVVLPDGSYVWLNAASKLTYPATFGDSKVREVELTGEAYFEVAKDKLHPFIVHNGHQKIEVLGTHFNVNSYADEPETKTTLLEGRVKVTNVQKKNIFLEPGEQALLSLNNLGKRKVDVDEAVAWRNGMFDFSDESLESIMRKIARWYDVDVEYADESIKNLPLTGIITHFTKVSKVLRMLELTKQVHFKIDGRKIIVSK